MSINTIATSTIIDKATQMTYFSWTPTQNLTGFVSFCWGITRKVTGEFIDGINNGTYNKVGTYNTSSPSSTDLKNAYKLLQTGNAVVNTGHTFLIDTNLTSSSKVYCYEQTPYNAQYTVWTYDQLVAGLYLPFGLK